MASLGSPLPLLLFPSSLGLTVEEGEVRSCQGYREAPDTVLEDGREAGW